MKKLILLAMLVAGAFTVSATSVAKADHWGGCNSGWGGGYYSSGYSYAPSYYAPSYNSYYAPSYGYGNRSYGSYYRQPGFSISIGSGYRGSGYGGYGGQRGHSHGHSHRGHRH
ncbi:MAG: hypothetical protein IAG10_35250 [Planctomycetaceae bacterium]|nr:hypothetical protein [Planctomycetaceae bacterium]